MVIHTTLVSPMIISSTSFVSKLIVIETYRSLIQQMCPEFSFMSGPVLGIALGKGLDVVPGAYMGAFFGGGFYFLKHS